MTCAAPAAAQTLATTTLSAAVTTSTTTTVTVVASTIQQGQWLWVDREAMLVTGGGGTTSLTVTRGIAGIASSHLIGGFVYFGPPTFFQRNDPSSSSCQNQPNVWINVDAGTMFSCYTGTWRSLTSTGPGPVGTVAAGAGALLPPQFTTDFPSNLPSGSCYSWNSDTFLQRVAANSVGLSATCGGANTGTFNGGTFTFSGGHSLVGTTANVTGLRNGTSAQAWNVYKTSANADVDKEYLSAFADSNGFHIQTRAGGTGSSRSVFFGVNAGDQWGVITGTGHWVPQANNTYDIGTSIATVRTGYFGTSVVAPLFRAASATQLALSTDGTAILTNNANAGYSIVGTAAQAWFKASDGTSDTATVKAHVANFTGKYQINAVDGVSCASAGTVTSVFGIVTACSAPSAEMFGSDFHLPTFSEWTAMQSRLSALESTIKR